jgi:hypothetical protein
VQKHCQVSHNVNPMNLCGARAMVPYSDCGNAAWWLLSPPSRFSGSDSFV